MAEATSPLICGSNGNLTMGSKYQLWTSAIANALRRVHPNLITLTGLASGLGAAYLLWKRKSKVLAIALYILYLVCDTLDGCIARGTGKGTSFGAKLDKYSDMVITYAVLAAAYLRCPKKQNDAILVFILWKLFLMFKVNYKQSTAPLVKDMEFYKLALFILLLFLCEINFQFLPRESLFGSSG